MNDNELLEMVITERVNTLLANRDRSEPKSKKHHDLIFKAENIIDSLPPDDKEVILYYVNSIIERLAIEEPYLYRHGFLDGLKVFKKYIKFFIAS